MVRFTKLNDYFSISLRVDLEDVNAPDSLVDNDVISSYEKAKNSFLRGISPVDQNVDLIKIARGFQQKTLLFIDNYEQIQADEELDLRIRRELISPFINNPLVTIVITSRIIMKIETFNFEVKPLKNASAVNGMSSIDLANHYSSIRMFFKEHNQFASNNRIKKVDFNEDDCDIIIRLCDMVSNLPLGIKLIASRSCEIKLNNILSSFNLSSMERRPLGWEEFSERHRSLYNAFFWSFNLLNKNEQILCAYFSIFNNGFYIDSIGSFSVFNKKDELTNMIIKMSDHSILREYNSFGKKRYELYVFASEMLVEGIKDRSVVFDNEFFINTGNKYFCQLNDIINTIFTKQEKEIDYNDLVERVRIDIENIKYFSNRVFDLGEISMSIHMLCALEKILFEIGPYEVLINDFRNFYSFDAQNTMERARICLSYGKILQSTEQRELSWEIAYEAMELLSSIEKNKEVVNLLGDCYVTLAYLTNVHDRKLLLDSFFSESIDFNQHVVGNMHQAKGRYLESIGQVVAAKNEFEKSITLLSDYPLQLGKALNYFGLFLWREGFFYESKIIFCKAISTYEKIGATRWVQGFKTNIGLLCADTCEFDLGFKLVYEVQEELEINGPYDWFYINKHAQARLLARSRYGDNDQFTSLSILKECSSVFEEIKYWEALVLCLADLSELYYYLNQFQLALESANKCLYVASKFGISKMMRIFRALSIASLSSSELNSFDKSHDFKVEALNLLKSVPENQWLKYPNTKFLYDKIIDQNE